MLTTLALAATLLSPPAPLRERVDDLMTRLEGHGFSGVLLLAKDGEIVLEKGYGLADRGKKLPATPDTVYCIGSITKQFTAAAILKLEMQGKLSVTDPISRFFPGVPADKKGITLHHLLTHTAGLREDYGETDFEPVSREEIVSRVLSAPLLSAPGEKFRYSNAGYSLLAAVVELTTKGPYEAYLREQLFLPAGMTRTGYKLPGWKPGELARGWRGDEEWGTTIERPWAPDGQPWWNLRGNGGIHATARDMWRWHQALLGTAILSEEAKRKLYGRHIAEEMPESWYGYGWSIATTPRKTTLITHNGGNGIFAADFRRYVDEKIVWFIASNEAGMPAIPVSDMLAGLVFRGEAPLVPRTVVLSADALAARAGTYRLADGGAVAVAVKDGRLAFTADGAAAMAALLGEASVDAPRAASFKQRSRTLLEESRKGNVAPIHEAFGGGIPLARIRTNEAERWKDAEAAHGAFRGTTVLAAFPAREGAIAVLVRLDFERGAAYRQLVWEQGRLAGIRVLDAPPAAVLTPTGPDTAASFDVRSGRVTEVRFDGATLVLPGGTRATR
jgi:CubicO group peptidase (beta-lactamase class C family)